MPLSPLHVTHATITTPATPPKHPCPCGCCSVAHDQVAELLSELHLDPAQLDEVAKVVAKLRKALLAMAPREVRGARRGWAPDWGGGRRGGAGLVV